VVTVNATQQPSSLCFLCTFTMATQGEIEVIIREQCARLGSLSAALQYVSDLLLSPAQRSAAVDVFPSCHLAGGVHRLCRCRGMIQEVQPEVNLFCAHQQHFLSLSPTVDAATPAEKDAVEFMDAVALYVIPVPGNDHFYTVEDTTQTTEAAHGTAPTAPMSTACGEVRAARKRRGREDTQLSSADADDAEQASATLCGGIHSDGDGSRDAKLAKTGDAGVKSGLHADTVRSASTHISSAAGDLSLNFPHPSRHPQLRTACVVTVLMPSLTSARGEADRQRNPFRINDVVDFYGFQHFPDDQLAVNEEDDFLRFSAWNATELSRGLVSRLLCLAYSPVSSVHLTRALSTDNMDAAAVAQQRTRAIRYICEHITDGDDLAAEYLLMHLGARVNVHSDALPVGDLPLLITSPQLCAETWSHQLRRITPVAEVYLDADALLSSSSAAHHRLTPRYNNELNFLQSGVLQVANGSHVTLDCTNLGTQDGTWYEGMFALVHKQQLLLEYPYQTLELPVDVSVLALYAAPDSAALHPLFRFALRLTWEPSSSLSTPHPPQNDAAQSVSAAAEDVRRYLTLVRNLPFRTEGGDESISAQASATLLEMTRDIPGWNNRDPLLHNNSFSAATALMRARAASYGRSNFTSEDIAAVRQLERARMARLEL
jgi:hypothetical protein